MNKLKLASVCLATLLGCHSLHAQEAKVELREPLIARMPDRSSWIIQTVNKSAPPAKPGQPPQPPATVTIAKNGTTYQVRYQPPINGYKEVWSINGRVLVVLSSGTEAASVSGSMLPYTDFSASDFPDFAWLIKSDFKGKQTIQSQEVLVFETETTRRQLTAYDRARLKTELSIADIEPAPSKGGPDGESLSPKKGLATLGFGDTTQVWLDPASQRPLQLISGDRHLAIRYLPGEPQLTEPPAVVDRLNWEKKNLESFQTHLSHPRP